MKRSVLLASALAVLLNPFPVLAETALYMGGSVGRGDINASGDKLAKELRDLGNAVNSVKFDGEDSAYRVYAGVHMTKYFAVEVGYVDLGSATTDVDAVVTDKLLEDTASVAPAMPKGPTVSAIGILPATLIGFDEDSVWGRFSLLLKFGFIDPDVDVRASVSGTPVTRKVTDAETQYGMGIQFRMGEKVSFRAEVERFDFSRIVTYTSASLQFRF